MNKTIIIQHLISAPFQSLRVGWIYGVLFVCSVSTSACGYNWTSSPNTESRAGSHTEGIETSSRSDEDQNTPSLNFSTDTLDLGDSAMTGDVLQEHGDFSTTASETNNTPLALLDQTTQSSAINHDIIDSESIHNPADSPVKPTPTQPETLAHAVTPDDQDKIPVSLILSGLKIQQGGSVCVAIYNNSQTFLTKTVFHWECIGVDQVNPAISFSLSSPGEYAFSVLHDADNNNELTRNWFGFPKEGFGFSNNPILRTGPPQFHHASTWINKAKRMMIQMTYL